MFKVKVVSHLRQKNLQTLWLTPTEAHTSKKISEKVTLKGNPKIVTKEMPNEGTETN